MVDTTDSLLIEGILLGSILGLFASVIVTSYFRYLDGKLLVPEKVVSLICAVGYVVILIMLTVGLFYPF